MPEPISKKDHDFLKEFDEVLHSIFQPSAKDLPPLFLVEIGCRDGFFLKHAYEYVNPSIEVVAFILDENRVDEVREDLHDTPHRIAKIVNTKSETILSALKDVGIHDVERVLFMETFSNKHTARRFRDYVHLKSPYGMIQIQLHGIDKDSMQGYEKEIEEFQSTYATDLAELPTAEAYLIEAASEGWFPKPGSIYHLPRSSPLTLLTITHFTHRPYRVRYATVDDLPKLLELEEKSWKEPLRVSKEILLERITNYPQGQYVLETIYDIEGVLYSQRIADYNSLNQVNIDTVKTLHDPRGNVVFLLALSMLPERQNQGLGSQLLEFVLQKAALINHVTHATGVTMCSSYPGSDKIDVNSYIKAVTESGELLDPVLRMHFQHGAKILGAVPNYRPKDIANEGYGVQILYTLSERKPLIREAKKVQAKTAIEITPAFISATVDKEILKLLEKDQRSKYTRHASLIELGLQSLQFLALRTKLNDEFGLGLNPAFFNQYNTAEMIIRFLIKNKIKMYEDWLYEIDWQPQALVEKPFIALDRLFIIFADPQCTVALELKKTLIEGRQHCVLVYPGEEYRQIDASTYISGSRSFKELFKNISLLPQLEGVIYMWGFDCHPQPKLESLEALHHQLIEGAISLANVMAQLILPMRSKFWIVTKSLNTDGTLESLVQWPLNALTKVIREEYSKSQCSYVALDGTEDAQTSSKRLLNELKDKSSEPQIAWRQGQRLVARMVNKEFEETPPPQFSAESSYMIVGGLRPLGLMIAQWCISKGVKHLILLDELEISSEATKNIDRFREEDIDVVVYIAPFDEPVQIETVFDQIKRLLSPLRGVIHAAGVIDHELLMHMDWKRLKHTYRLKVASSWMVHQLTQEFQLDHFFFFSSILTDFIPLGRTSHAIGNSFLDALTHYRSKLGLQSLAINWGPWQRHHVETKHMIYTNINRLEMLTIDEAMKVFERIFNYKIPQIIAADIRWPTMFQPTSADNPLFESQAIKAINKEVEKEAGASEDGIAIIGMSCRFPGASNLNEFWELLVSSHDPIQVVPPDRWNVEEYYSPDANAPGNISSRYGGFIPSIDKFDAPFFSLSSQEAEMLDPEQRVLLELTYEALENAAIPLEKIRSSKADIFVGISKRDYEKIIARKDNSPDNAANLLKGNLSLSAEQLATFLDTHGQNISIDTATSSSAIAIHQACQSLLKTDCPLAIAAGINIILSPNNSICLTKLQVIAPDGRCKVFDSSANGICRSEGCGVVILKRVKDAVRDGDRIFAVIRSSATNQGSVSSDVMTPTKDVQVDLFKAALTEAHLDPHAIDYIEAQGIGTPLGDRIEMSAIKEVYGHKRKDNQPLLVGSVKSNIGHLEAASGIAGLIKVVLSLQYQLIPRNLNLTTINPDLLLPLFPAQIVAESHAPWTKTSKHIRRAAISSFGLFGTNCHLIVEEAPILPVTAPSVQNRKYHILTLSAKSNDALIQTFEEYDKFMISTPHSFADIAYTSNIGRTPFEHRLALVASSLTEARQKIASKDYKKGLATLTDQAKVAFLFGGEGIQYVGMGKQLYFSNSTFKVAIDRCAQAIQNKIDESILDILFFDERLLNKSGYLSIAIFAVEYGLFEVWKSLGIYPTYVLGYGIGEFVAAVAAGMLSVEEALTLIIKWSELTQTDNSDKIRAIFTNDVEIKPPQISFLSSVTGEMISDIQPLPDYWMKLLPNPVSLEKGVETLHQLNTEIFLEVSPQAMLSDLATQRVSSPKSVWLTSLKKGYGDWNSIIDSLAELYVRGIKVQWQGLGDHALRSKVLLPTYPFQRALYPLKPLHAQTSESQISLPPTQQPVSIVTEGTVSPTRQLIRKSLEDILEFNSEDIEDDRGFFDLGLDSLTAVQLHKSLQIAFGNQLTLESTAIFYHPTVNELATYIDEKLPKSFHQKPDTHELKEEISSDEEMIIKEEILSQNIFQRLSDQEQHLKEILRKLNQKSHE